MANSAANLVGASVQFGVIDASNIFTPDTNAQIIGSTDSTIKIQASSSEFSGNMSVQGTLSVIGPITGTVIGNATSATRLATARSITANGDAIGSITFDGTKNEAMSIVVQKVQNVSFYTGAAEPTGSTRLNMDGYFYATRIYNAVWNDIADFIEVEKDTPIQYGSVYIRNGLSHRIACKYAEKGAVGIASDTYGFGVGQDSDKHQIPIAIGGFVLAHCSQEYESGTPLVASSTGGLTKANLLIRVFHPERILATYYKPESLKTWNDIEVADRHWVKVR